MHFTATPGHGGNVGPHYTTCDVNLVLTSMFLILGSDNQSCFLQEAPSTSIEDPPPSPTLSTCEVHSILGKYQDSLSMGGP